MEKEVTDSADSLFEKLYALFKKDIVLENDYLRQENIILRSKLGKRVPLTGAERRILAKYGIRIKNHLKDVISIVQPETLLKWHRYMKKKKWTFDNKPKKPGQPRISEETFIISDFQPG